MEGQQAAGQLPQGTGSQGCGLGMSSNPACLSCHDNQDFGERRDYVSQQSRRGLPPTLEAAPSQSPCGREKQRERLCEACGAGTRTCAAALGELWRAGGDPESISPGILILWPSSPPFPSWELSTSLSLPDRTAGHHVGGWTHDEGLGPELWAGRPREPRSPGNQQGPRGETQDRAEAPGRGPSQEMPSHKGDLCGGTAGGRTTSQGGGSRSWGLGVSRSPETHQTARAMWPHLLSGT